MGNIGACILTWLVALWANHMVSAIRCAQCNATRGTCHSGALPSQPCPSHMEHCFTHRVWTPPRSHWGRSFVWRGCSALGPEVQGCTWVHPRGQDRYMRCIEICNTNHCNSAYAPEGWQESVPTNTEVSRRRRRALRRAPTKFRASSTRAQQRNDNSFFVAEEETPLLRIVRNAVGDTYRRWLNFP